MQMNRQRFNSGLSDEDEGFKFDSADFLYNGTPWEWLAQIYECSDAELDEFIKRTPLAVAEERCMWWAFKVLDNDGKQEC